MNKNTFCAECGQENESEYEYCKNCGARLKKENTLKSELASEPQNSGAFAGAYINADNTIYGTRFDNIDGIPADEIALFVGRKSPLFLRKFSSMQLSDSNVSWCWPVAVLGILLGPMGAALWFFYRKMYKHAFIISAAGALTAILISLLRGNTNIYSGVFEGSIYDNAAQFNRFIQMSGGWREILSKLLNSVVNIFTAVLLGIFSLSMYKKFAVSKIREYRTKSGDPRYYRMGLSIIGGTGVGMVWVGILLIILASVLADVIIQAITIF